MRLAAQDVSRLARAAAMCTGALVTLLAVLALLSFRDVSPVPALTSGAPPAPTAVAAFCAAGIALLLLSPAGRSPARRYAGYAVAAAAALTGAVGLVDAATGASVTAATSRLIAGVGAGSDARGVPPDTALGLVLLGTALAVIDLGSARRSGGGRFPLRASDALLVGAATVALMALVPRLFAAALPPGQGSVAGMSPYLAGGLLAVTVGGALARPDRGPLGMATGPGPGAALGRRLTPALLALPFVAAIFSAVAARTGSRPAAAVGTGTVLAALAVLAFVAHLRRSLEDADHQQRGLVAELREKQEFTEDRNAQLRESNQRLENALSFKRDLVSMLSHDVAQPVSSIASLSELLVEDWKNLPDETRLELVTKIDKNTRRLISMMNDMTLLFRLETGSVTARRTPVPVREVVEQVVADVGPEDGDVAVLVEPGLSALADRGHLWRMLQNLLANAIAYGEAPVLVEAAVDRDRIVLVVQDQGKGIPEELVPKLFDRFMRGVGMGLFIVRQLAEANGGSVRYEPATPRGARLVLSLESAHTTIPAAPMGDGDPD